MKTFRRVFITTSLALAATAAASADTIVAHTGVLSAVSTNSAGPTNFNFGNGSPQQTVGLSLAQFNCASVNGADSDGIGTDQNCALTSIHFTIHGTIDTTYTVQNQSGSDSTWNITSSATLAIVSGGSPNFTFVEALPTTSITTPVIANGSSLANVAIPSVSADGAANYSCTGTTCTLDNVTPAGTPVSSPIDAAPFIGTGTLTLFAAGNFTGSIGGTGFTGGIGGTGSETVTVQYDYSYNEVIPSSTTPEPVSMALVGGGLIGLGLFRKRLRAKSA